AEALDQDVVLVVESVLEDLAVGQELDRRAVVSGVADSPELSGRLAADELLDEGAAIAVDFGFQMLRQGVDDRNADPVQSAGTFVATAAKLAAGVQHRQDDLERRPLLHFVHVDWNAAAVVDHRDRAISVDGDQDIVAFAGERLVDTVVDNLVNQVV